VKYRQLNLNLLVVLDVLLREKSVSRTAARLHLTQAAVSVQLAKLREHFSDELLVVQPGRWVELTDFGRRLIDPVSDLLEKTEAILEMRAAFDPANAERRFRIATADIETAIVLSRVSRRLSTEAPGIHLQMKELHPGRHLESAAVSTVLEQTNNDFIIVPKGVHSLQHDFDFLYRQPYVCLLCKDNPEVGATLDRQQYLEMTHVVRQFGDEDCGTFDANYLRAHGLQRKTGPVVDTYMVIPEMLVGTSYIATVHQQLAEDFVTRYPLRIVPCPIELPNVESVLQWRPHLNADPAALWLRGIFQDVAPTQPRRLAA